MNISLTGIVKFSATKPLVTIGLWVLITIAAAILSAIYLGDALSGGQGSTTDLESVLARKLKDEKLALPNAILDVKILRINSKCKHLVKNQVQTIF